MPVKKLVQSVTVGAGGAASIEFTSIPQTGTDLLIICSLRNTNSNQKLWVQFNSSTTGYSYRGLAGDGTSAFSGANGDGTDRIATNTFVVPIGTDTFGNCSLYIPNYSGSTAKSVSIDAVGEANASTAYMDIDAASWSGTAAIASIKLFLATNLAQYSTASLYIITKGSGGATVA